MAAAEGAAQLLVSLEMEEGSSVGDALAGAVFVEPALASRLQPDTVVGVWGRPVSRDHALREGDRIEIYSGIRADAKALRRARASLSPSPRRRNGS